MASYLCLDLVFLLPSNVLTDLDWRVVAFTSSILVSSVHLSKGPIKQFPATHNIKSNHTLGRTNPPGKWSADECIRFLRLAEQG